MQITIFSIFMALVFGNILIIFLYLCRKKYCFIKAFGVSNVICLYLLCAWRVLLPLELPFTRVLHFNGFVSNFLYDFLWGKIGIFQISGLGILSILMTGVTVILISDFVWRYNKTVKVMLSSCRYKDERCINVLEKVIKDKRYIKIEVIFSEHIDIPMGLGIIKKWIVLPEEKYSDLELYYILLHEYTHFLNRDLYIKMLIHIFCCFFWWNPIALLLKKDLGQTLEIKCDLCVTEQMTVKNKADYLTTIVSTLKKLRSRKQGIPLYLTNALVIKDDKYEIVERFKMISENSFLRIGNKFITAALLTISTVVMLLSYSFVIQTAYDSPLEQYSVDQEIFEIHGGNSYILKNTDGTYDLICQNGETDSIKEKTAIRMEAQGIKIIEAGEIE